MRLTKKNKRTAKKTRKIRGGHMYEKIKHYHLTIKLPIGTVYENSEDFLYSNKRKQINAVTIQDIINKVKQILPADKDKPFSLYWKGVKISQDPSVKIRKITVKGEKIPIGTLAGNHIHVIYDDEKTSPELANYDSKDLDSDNEDYDSLEQYIISPVKINTTIVYEKLNNAIKNLKKGNTHSIKPMKTFISENRNTIKYADEMIALITEFQTIENPTKKQIQKLSANLFNIIIDN